MGALTLTRRAFALGTAALPLAPAIARSRAPIETGLDRLIAGEGKDKRGDRIALLTHDAARNSNGRRRAVAEVAALSGIKLVGLLSPEHGLDGRAAAGEPVPDGRDRATGLPIYSLYGKDNAAPEELLAQVDTIMIDLQDVGLRPFTYAATMIEAMRLAESSRKRVFLLDRPNPLGGARIDGPMVAPTLASKVGALPTPFRHGLTMGEIALLAHSNEKLRCEISCLAMNGWHREIRTRDLYERYAQPFTAPSPNLRSPAAILAYAATVLIEGTNLSEGRGSLRPFQMIGAPWLKGEKLQKRLSDLALPGVAFAPARFRPDASKYKGEDCAGIELYLIDEQTYDPLLTGLTLIAAVRELHPRQFVFLGGPRPFFDLLTGQSWVREALLAGEAPAAIVKRWQGDVAAFAAQRRPFLLYQESAAHQR